MFQLKRICYRGGIARFDIPASWKEEYEPSGGGTFYEDVPDTGTLRLNVLSITSNGKATSAEMIENLVAKDGYDPLQDGLAIRKYVKSAMERHENLRLYRWEVAVPVEPCSARLAMFTYTILASQEDYPKIRGEIAMLEDSICAAEFSREKGVSGDFS